MNRIISIVKFVRKKLQLYINKIGSVKRGNRLKYKEVTIISNNCFAGITYEYLNMPFYSPTIGLYFFAPEYIKFIKDIKKYIKMELVELKPEESKYYDELKKTNQDDKVIGLLGDVEIVFLHYQTFEEAKNKWNRRCKRINFDKIIYKFNDQNLCTEKELKEFHEFHAKNKICFTAKKYDYGEFIQLKKYKKNNYVKEDAFYYHKYFDIVDYINNLKI